MRNEILQHYFKLVGMKKQIHGDWRLWLDNEILAIELIMEGRHDDLKTKTAVKLAARRLFKNSKNILLRLFYHSKVQPTTVKGAKNWIYAAWNKYEPKELYVSNCAVCNQSIHGEMGYFVTPKGQQVCWKKSCRTVPNL